MSQNSYPDIAWQGLYQPQPSSFHSAAGVGTAGAMGVDGTGGVSTAQPDLDLNDFTTQVGDLSGASSFNSTFAASVFSGFSNHGGFMNAPYNGSMFTSSAWPQPPVSASSTYSTLDGAISNPQSSQQPHVSQATQSIAIDPSLTMASATTSRPESYTSPIQPPPQPNQSYASSSQYQPYSHISPSALSIPNSLSAASPFQQQQSPSQSQHVTPAQSPPQSTMSPFAMHAPAPIPPARFYNATPAQVALTPPSASSSVEAQPQHLQVSQIVDHGPTAAQREALRAAITPCLQEKSFTGARAVQTLAAAIAEFGIAQVDVPMRLEILNKTLQNAGNNYYRAWMENVSAMDITREWLKATASSSAQGQVLETTMPLLTLLDRLPFTGTTLKACKVGALVRRLTKGASNAAVKDMASNLERKWMDKFVGHDQMDVDKDLKGQKRKSDRERDSASAKAAPPAKKIAVTGSNPKALSNITGNKETKSGQPSTGNSSATGVKESKADASFFSKPKPKLPTFKKAPLVPVKKEDTTNVAQPSNFNPFQEALKDMETQRNRRDSPAAVASPPAPTPAPITGTPANLSKSGKPKKRVTWAPDGQLEAVRLIERALYDDDSVSGTHAVHNNLRDLDKGEGAALHLAADTFEELIDWVEPTILEIRLPDGVQRITRGEGSEEKFIQERREETALRAMYLAPGQVPDTPGEPANTLPLDQVDAQVRVMMTGGEVQALLREQAAHQQSANGADDKPQATVSELIGQLGGSQQAQPAPTPQAIMDAQAPIDPNVAAQLSQPQLQNLLQLLNSAQGVPPSTAAPPPTNRAQDSWSAQASNGFPAPPPTPPYSNGDTSARWENSGSGPPSRGNGWRGRGRGRGRGKSRTPCTFFLQGRCRYGDQCDFSHEMSYG